MLHVYCKGVEGLFFSLSNIDKTKKKKSREKNWDILKNENLELGTKIGEKNFCLNFFPLSY